jgi:hypothetical protein
MEEKNVKVLDEEGIPNEYQTCVRHVGDVGFAPTKPSSGHASDYDGL